MVSRGFIVLENVIALLSRNKQTRVLMSYVVQD